MRLWSAVAAVSVLVSCAELTAVEKAPSLAGDWEHEDQTVVLSFLRFENDGKMTARFRQTGGVFRSIPGT